jgi:type I restriction enzyme M protein
MQNDGYTLDDKRNKTDKSDLQDIITQYHKKPSNASSEKEREGLHFSIAKQEIIENTYDLSFSKYRKEIYEEVTYEEPKLIFEKLENIEASILKGISELKELI